MYCKSGTHEQFQTLTARGLLAAEGYVTPTLTVQRKPIALIARDAATECPDAGCCWWLVTVHPWGGQRTIVGAGPIPIPAESVLAQRNAPGVTVLKALLVLADGAGRQRQVIVDIGAGFTLGWYGPSVSVSVLITERNTVDYNANTLIGRSQKIVQGSSPLIAPAASSAVEDVLIEANIVPMLSSPNIRAQTLTNTYRQFLTAPEGFVRVAPRPAGAERVSVYQDQAGGSGPSFATRAEPPFTGLTAADAGEPLIQMPGVVFPGQSNVVPHQAVPGYAAGVIPSAGLEGTTIVWEIDP